jgi:hypothetical protein
MKALGDTLYRNLMGSLRCLWEILKTTSLIVIAVAVGLAIGQLHCQYLPLSMCRIHYKYGLRITTIQEIFEPGLDSSYLPLR